MTLVPAATPDTNPDPLTVAISGEAETHAFEFAAVGEPVNWVVDPAQTVNVPEIEGSALTVTVAVILQPRLLV